MKVINFFNRFALICNFCFLIAMMSKSIPSFTTHFIFKDFILILALIAFVINAIMILVTILGMLSPKRAAIGKFVFGLNIAFFALQVFYFFNS
jgi:hypothetical protein